MRIIAYCLYCIAVCLAAIVVVVLGFGTLVFLIAAGALCAACVGILGGVEWLSQLVKPR